MRPPSFVTAILLAAGAGGRFGGETLKQFALLGGEPVFVHPLRVLVSSLHIEAIVVVFPAVRDLSMDEASRLPKVRAIIRGGATRQASLAKAMASLPAETDVVLVHDAARPFLEEEYLSSVLEPLGETYDGAICAVPLEDTLKRAADGEILGSVERESVWRAQTPQAFKRVALEQALARAEQSQLETTDCSELLTRAGYRVRLVEADPLNIKLTRPQDLLLAELILQARSGGPEDPIEE